MKIQLTHSFEEIISLENLLAAWPEFLRGKRNKTDVLEFSRCLMSNILALHHDLKNQTYQHGGYEHFKISDPKPRDIHKASVRDRLLHHAIYRQLQPFFDKTFIADSYSCRLDKGTHKALNHFRKMIYHVSQNNTKTVWVLQCDIRKFFASIDHQILLDILSQYIGDAGVLWLLRKVIKSFSTTPGKGLPLGNLTSQLLVNIYMNKFDQFVKHQLKVKNYIRYADDFVILTQDRKWLENILPPISDFLRSNLELQLHPNKVSIQTICSGVDFLGWVNFPDHRILRTKTKKRMFGRIKTKSGQTEVVQSYLGLISHGNTCKLRQKLLNYRS